MAESTEPLQESGTPIEIDRFMGRWYVLAAIPTPLDKGAMNAIEDYAWDADAERIQVTYTMQRSKDGPVQKILQRASLVNSPTNTRWSLDPKVLGLYLPLKLPYLVVDCAADYSTTIIGLPDRSILYVMARSPTVDERCFGALLQTCFLNGYDLSKIERVSHSV
jgi:apolipoprotein D and lipocalin family protein